MKFPGFPLLFSLIVAVSCLTSQSQAREEVTHKQTLTLSYERSWLPYIYRDQQGKLKGIDGELLSQTLAKMDYQLELFPVPENRLKEVIGQGNIDVAIAAFKNTQRQKSNWFSIPYRTERTVFAYLDHRAKEFAGKDIYQLVQLQNTYSLGLNNGAWYGQRFETQVKQEHKYQCFHIEGIERRLKMLSVGRVDLIIGDLLALKAAAKSLGITNIKFSHSVIYEDDVHFIFSKKRVKQTFVERFNKLLEQALNPIP